MSEMEGVSYAVFAVYVLTWLGLTAAAAKLGGSAPAHADAPSTLEMVTRLAARLALLGVGLWPLLRAAHGEPLHPDPVQAALDGLAGDLTGHLLLVLGALFAMTAQMHADTARRKKPARTYIDSGPFAISRRPVALGRLVMALGLFLVFPGVAQGLATLVLYLADTIALRVAEQRLAADIGAPYAAYLARVPCWLGRPRSISN